MPKYHLALALVIGPIFLIMLVNWSEPIQACACHAVLVPECGPTVSAVSPEHVACPK